MDDTHNLRRLRHQLCMVVFVCEFGCLPCSVGDDLRVRAVLSETPALGAQRVRNCGFVVAVAHGIGDLCRIMCLALLLHGTRDHRRARRDRNNRMISTIVGHCRRGGRVVAAARGASVSTEDIGDGFVVCRPCRLAQSLGGVGGDSRHIPAYSNYSWVGRSMQLPLPLHVCCSVFHDASDPSYPCSVGSWGRRHRGRLHIKAACLSHALLVSRYSRLKQHLRVQRHAQLGAQTTCCGSSAVSWLAWFSFMTGSLRYNSASLQTRLVVSPKWWRPHGDAYAGGGRCHRPAGE